MSTKFLAFVLSFLSIFALWGPNAQPNNIPETRSYQGDAPDKYEVWPTEEFERGDVPFWLRPGLLKAAYEVNDFFSNARPDSFLVLYKGKLVFEEYYNGYDKDTVHFMASVTKSVVSALVGVAIGEGKIKGVDQKVIDFFPDAVIAPGQESKRDMTVEHLLTMTNGLPGDNDPVDWEWWDAPDSGKAAFETPQMAAPGTKYSYSSGPGAQTLACLVSRAVGQNLSDYAKEKLFGPLGMTSVQWGTTEDGQPTGGFGINMTPRDMARFGYLYLNYGRWGDKQMIPADYVLKSPPRAMTQQAYGYMFWNFRLLPMGGFGFFEASGAQQQKIAILPGLDTVIVLTSTEFTFWERLGLG